IHFFNDVVGCRDLHSSARMGRMVGNGRESLASVSTIRVRTAASAARGAQTVPTAAAPGFGAETPTFHFDGPVDGVSYPSLSPAPQETFKAEFFKEIASLKSWARQQDWSPSVPPALQIFVSDEYKISRSLIPAALDCRGRMEFPAWKAIAGEAAIAHELVQDYFLNGNRFMGKCDTHYTESKN